MQQGAPSQLAFCNTLASQASSRQKVACGSLETSLVQQELCKRPLLRTQTEQARRLRRSSPARPRPAEGKQKGQGVDVG